MAKKLYLSVLIGGIVILGIYYLLGGFSKVSIRESDQKSFEVAGRYFYGKYDDPDIREYFLSARDSLLAGKVKGELCVVAFRSDTLKEDYISQFIGVALNEAGQSLPEFFERRVFTSNQVASAVLDMHPMARPNPENLQDDLTEFMTTKGWQKPVIFIEIYKPDDSMIIHAVGK